MGLGLKARFSSGGVKAGASRDSIASKLNPRLQYRYEKANKDKGSVWYLSHTVKWPEVVRFLLETHGFAEGS